jgi:hypothetical protein
MVGSLSAVGSRRLAGVMVLVAGVLGCVLPQAASASGVSWQLNGKPTTEPVAVTMKGTVKFSDLAGGVVGGEITIECKIAGKGYAGAGAADEVTQFTPSACLTTHGLCTSPGVTISDIPWHSELSESEGKLRDALTTGGKGSPEYRIACEDNPVEDHCSGATSTAIANVSGGVDATFDGKAQRLTCTIGGKNDGVIEGTMLVENPAGGTLTAADNPPQGWWLGGVLTTSVEWAKSSGTLTFTAKANRGGIVDTVECKTSGEEAVGPRVAGEVTKWAATGCVNSHGDCPTPGITARNLPWHTELVTVEGAIRDLITNSGKGTPEYELKCGSASEYEYACSWNASTAMENVLGNVDASFNEENRGCTEATDSNISGKEVIKAEDGKELTVK